MYVLEFLRFFRFLTVFAVCFFFFFTYTDLRHLVYLDSLISRDAEMSGSILIFWTLTSNSEIEILEIEILKIESLSVPLISSGYEKYTKKEIKLSTVQLFHFLCIRILFNSFFSKKVIYSEKNVVFIIRLIIKF